MYSSEDMNKVKEAREVAWPKIYIINITMTRNKNKIIRSVTVSQSLGFCREVMIKMRTMGYEMVALTSPGPELDKLRDEDEFHCVIFTLLRYKHQNPVKAGMVSV